MSDNYRIVKTGNIFIPQYKTYVLFLIPVWKNICWAGTSIPIYYNDLKRAELDLAKYEELQ